MTSQVPAPKHLKVISTASGLDWEKQDEYHYDDTAGRGIRIYVIDSGLQSDHEVRCSLCMDGTPSIASPNMEFSSNFKSALNTTVYYQIESLDNKNALENQLYRSFRGL